MKKEKERIKEIVREIGIDGAEQQLGYWVVYAFGKRFYGRRLREAIEMARQYKLKLKTN